MLKEFLDVQEFGNHKIYKVKPGYSLSWDSFGVYAVYVYPDIGEVYVYYQQSDIAEDVTDLVNFVDNCKIYKLVEVYP